MIGNNFIETSNLSRIPDAKNTQNRDKTLKELNGFFISHFFKIMYETVDILNSEESFTGGSGEKIFRDFLINEYGKTMSGKFELTNNMMDRYFSNKDSTNNSTVNVES